MSDNLEKITMPKALMIKTEGGKYFLAKEETKPSLLAFAKLFKATVSLVDTKHTGAWDIRTIVEKLNHEDKLPDTPPPHTEEVPIYTPPEEDTESNNNTVIQRDNYQEFLSQAEFVKEHIKEELVKGKQVSLNSLQEWANHKKIELSKGGLSRHLQKTLDWAVGQGYSKIKEGRSYRIEK